MNHGVTGIVVYLGHARLKLACSMHCGSNFLFFSNLTIFLLESTAELMG